MDTSILSSIDLFAYVFVAMQVLLTVICIIFFISGIDDLFIDLCYWTRAFYRRVFIIPKIQPLTEDKLLNTPEKPIAVMIPAWDESSVIQKMLENTAQALNYENFYIFVGTYPNDPDTQKGVELARENHPRVQRTICPHDGPSNKADCLNWIYQGIKIFEQENNIQFQIFVMQDCEDVIHPLCYKLFNYLMPRMDMVQLPVLSLETKWHQFTAGHYIDEFSQLHYKDLIVREVLSRSIPAAGVGAAFSRRAFEIVCASNRNILFSTNSLTEDYDFGFRLKKHGLKQVFVGFTITRTTFKHTIFRRKLKEYKKKELICIREYFPSTFSTAVRQKSRWVVGIALQGWENLGWKWDFATQYMLYRDRRALITNLANFMGYLVVLLVATVWFVIWLNPNAYHYPPLLEQGTWLWYLVIINGIFFVLRIFHRAYCVYKFYNLKQAFLSFPRMILGNIINFFATSRAIRLYINYLRTGILIPWDKTAHNFPSEDELKAFRRKLGDLLLEHRIITVKQLEEALNSQRSQYRLLGEIFMDKGLIDHIQLNKFLQKQT
ncbi:glycosyl transferase family protein [Nitrosococcus watsonii]|uniref:Bacteriophage N4 adsorption protein B n=1 Tax=Nitrosococcus watsoni (strain C-113) TaxID=105559 RepID=D8KBD8_NITWC|nr:glycosyl transferase family protein [Nitrosococcus watsonii]ADJ29585.1 bacteriophage N4 adsorption protein B [Nitrosococcus watsonii C-113]